MLQMVRAQSGEDSIIQPVVDIFTTPPIFKTKGLLNYFLAVQNLQLWTTMQ
jgi:hypothetical protein